MTTITRERLEQALANPTKITFNYGETLELARIALASLEAEPVLYAAEETLAYAKHGELHLTCLSEPMGDAVIPLYATPPAQRMPDMNGFRPCPFCNSPVKWCGENCVDPDDEHVCHHIQCTNPECGADFDFINTGDDLLPDDPETLDAMTAAECLQPLRKVCLNRFNSRASMLQAGNGSTNGKPLTITLPDASSKAFWSSAGKGETFHPETYKSWVKEAIERAGFIAGIGVEVK